MNTDSRPDNAIGCYKTTNNKYFNCPPRMSDGRHFTDYRPSCDVNNLITANNGVVSSFDYRMFLQENAEKLMDLNRVYVVQKNACSPCVEPYNVGTMLPEKQMVTCNTNSCSNSKNILNGLGQGRNYGDKTDCGENWKWPKNVPPTSCSQSQDLFAYYDNNNSFRLADDFSRFTDPSGGDALTGGDMSLYRASK
jgi:hypothetical protein